MLAPGDRLDRYTIELVLGQGGMGVVYRAHDSRLQRRVALKVLHRGSEAAEAGGNERLLREARAAATLDHPNAVAIYDVGEIGGVPFIAMELVRGRPLRSLIGDASVSWRTRLRWLTDMARAVGAAHRAGLVHRDVKPENVMVRDAGDIKVLDFGIARRAIVDAAGSSAASFDAATETTPEGLGTLTGDGVAVGTPLYMAPEQIRCQPLDGRADQFAWGVVAYELLGGQSPWRHALASPPTPASVVLAAVLTSQPAPLRELAPEVPDAVAAVVARALAKEKEDRFASMDDIVAALEPHVTGAEPAPAIPVRRRWVPVVAVLALAAFATGWLIWGRPAPTGADLARPSSSAPTSTPRPEPTCSLDLPRPTHCNEASMGDYLAGVRAMHDNAWEVAHARMRSASAADPFCAEAHLRLSMMVQSEVDTQRAHYASAFQLRRHLSERDRRLLDALEPFLALQPADEDELNARMAQLQRDFPGDAELALLAAYYQRQDPVERERLARLALALDPEYGDAWEAVCYARLALGDRDGALAALNEAVRLHGIDCFRIRIDLREQRGSCAEIETDARTWLLRDPTTSRGYLKLARALAGGGGSEDAVREALAQRWAHALEAERKFLELEEGALLAAFWGDLAAATTTARELGQLVERFPDLESHSRHADLWLSLLLEAGQEAEALSFAEEFSRRKSVWARRPVSFFASVEEEPVQSIEPAILGLRRRLGSISAEETAAELDAWTAWTKPVFDPQAVWSYGRAAMVNTTPAASEAVKAMPPESRPERGKAVQNATAGRALLLAGEAARAVPFLRQASEACLGFSQVFAQTRARLLLGHALAKTGDEAGACAAYGAVLARWGKATPSSVTASEARASSKRLRCPP